MSKTLPLNEGKAWIDGQRWNCTDCSTMTADSIFWNPFNGVVQCHACGFVSVSQTAEVARYLFSLTETKEKASLASHTIQAAMQRKELTEEEAYFILRFAGRMGYDAAIKRLQSPLTLFRRWLVWFGGWETSELSQWDRGKKAWEFRNSRGELNDPFPMSLFGHRITLYGRWFQFRAFGGYVVFSNDYHDAWFNKIYWSPNGTPGHTRAKMFADWSNRVSKESKNK